MGEWVKKNKTAPRRKQSQLIDSYRDRFIKVTISSRDSVKNTRYSRYFNVGWFKFNYFTADRIANFGVYVNDYLNPRKYRFTVKEEKKGIVCKFWPLLDGLFDQKRRPVTVKVNGRGNITNIRKGKCLERPCVFALAVKLGVWERPRKWKTLTSLPLKEGDIFVRWRYFLDNEMKQVLQFNDRFGNTVKVPIKVLANDIFHFLSYYNRYRNLKQFKGVKNLEVFSRLISKKIKGESQKNR